MGSAGEAVLICRWCGTEAVETEVCDAESGLWFLRTTCPNPACRRELVLRQKHPQANPRSPVDEADEE